MTKKKLPVLASSRPAEDEPSALAWTGSGVLIALTLWLPLAFVALRASQALAPEAFRADAAALGAALLWTLGLHLSAFAVSVGCAAAAIARLGRATRWPHWGLIGALPWSLACALLSLGAQRAWQVWLGVPLAALLAIGSGWITRRFARG